MERLYDIKGYWSFDSDCITDEANVWEGQIILYDDNFFEGLVFDSKSSEKVDNLVSGVYYPDKVIELYEFLSTGDRGALNFHGKKSADGYEGKVEHSGPPGERISGSSRIVTQCSELSFEAISLKIKDLKDRIKKYTYFTISRDHYFWYTLFNSYRDTLCSIDLGQNDDSKNM